MIYSISSEVDVFCVILPLKKSKSNGVINRAEGGPSIGAVGRNHDKLDSHAPPKAGHRHSAQPTVAMRNTDPVLPNLHNFGGGGCAKLVFVGPLAAQDGLLGKRPGNVAPPVGRPALPPSAQTRRKQRRPCIQGAYCMCKELYRCQLWSRSFSLGVRGGVHEWISENLQILKCSSACVLVSVMVRCSEEKTCRFSQILIPGPRACR